jgi:hypothetical protein
MHLCFQVFKFCSYQHISMLYKFDIIREKLFTSIQHQLKVYTEQLINWNIRYIRYQNAQRGKNMQHLFCIWKERENVGTGLCAELSIFTQNV